MTDDERARFDALLQEALEALPPAVRRLLDEVPLIVEDRPDERTLRELAAEMGEEADANLAAEICGLYSGVALTERSVDAGFELPDDIYIYREGIINLAGGWETPDGDDAVYEEIMVTLLHEIGHHFGLSEQDLENLGYE